MAIHAARLVFGTRGHSASCQMLLFLSILSIDLAWSRTLESSPAGSYSSSSMEIDDDHDDVDSPTSDELDDDDDLEMLRWMNKTTNVDATCTCDVIQRAFSEIEGITVTCQDAASLVEKNNMKIHKLHLAVDGLAGIIEMIHGDELGLESDVVSITYENPETEDDQDNPLELEVPKPFVHTTQSPDTRLDNESSENAIDDVQVRTDNNGVHIDIPEALRGVPFVIMEPPDVLPRDCGEVQSTVSNGTGVYTILPDGCGQPFQVYCDMETDGGGWTVMQRRQDGSENFQRSWGAYRRGFGSLLGEHWLGLDKMSRLTMQDSYELRIDLIDFNGTRATAEYERIWINNFWSNFRLQVEGFKPNGSAGDSLSYHNYMPFTTYDRDNDLATTNCADVYPGGWWYNRCLYSNLNGDYNGPHSGHWFARGITWFEFGGFYDSMKFAEMKVRTAP